MGDSRIYLKRGDRFSQLTVDHTWVQEALESGVLSQDQVRSHPNTHLIRRYLGSKQPAIPDFRINLSSKGDNQPAAANQGMHLAAGDFLLLCTDGLTDLVSDDEIQSALENYPTEEILDRLINLANSRGGHDNITIIGIKVPDDQVIAPLPKRRNRLIMVLIVFALMVIAALAAWFSWKYFWEAESVSATQVPAATLDLGAPTFTQELISPTSPPPTSEDTPLDSPSPIPSDFPTTETAIPPTYTPWPTSTSSP
jgi:protein phosphatase